MKWISNNLPILFLAITFMFVLTGCSANEPGNQIMPMRLSDEQQKIVDMISTGGQQVILFEFDTSKPLSEMGMRLEVYEYGILTETHLSFTTVGMSRPVDGNISIVITENRGDNSFDWNVSLREGGSATSSRATTILHENMMGRAFGPMTEAVDITNNTDVVLFVSRFTNAKSLTACGDMQSYLNPDNFSRYPLVHVLIANFTY